MAKHPLHSMIIPRTLVSHVRNTVPFLFPGPKDLERVHGSLADKARGHMGWHDILTSAKQFKLSKNPTTPEYYDYFALCLAAHHATVASFVPTDVDTKIRRHLWHHVSSKGMVEKMWRIVQGAMAWDQSPVAARSVVDEELGPVSGLNGEYLSIMIPAAHAANKFKLTELCDEIWTEIENEIERESNILKNALQAGDHLRILKLSAILAHNAGDIDQGLNSCTSHPYLEARRQHISRMAHENNTVYHGYYNLAARIYKACMAREFHRNYPLRDIRILRHHNDFRLPMSPFLDDWGYMLATHGSLTEDDRYDILDGLVHACEVVKDQEGYYRAISGFIRGLDGQKTDIIDRLPIHLIQSWRSELMKKNQFMTAEEYQQQCIDHMKEEIPEMNPQSISYYLKS
ncbi:MAG: hypothetical protein HRU15_03445 [Planctomycetes bacterium]|nr:hypothetical protein [Planctomycetota bacterium]